ncbi:MAG: efflux RND transporter periplasmic adaptor subunit [Deltaproteobacteria bacterium]|nr:efflux RND transporter periplasmic adaptor subunit [Deltaproteobacteria bacterium]
MTGKKIFVISITVITFVIASTLAYSKFNGSSHLDYKTSIIDRGDIISYVSSSGTVNPIQSVRVLAQVSGVIKEIYVDFNSPVSKGEPLAQIDTTLYETQVKQARTALQKAQAEANQKGRLHRLYQKLANEPDRISKYELDNSVVEHTSALANVGKANADLKLAEANLQSTTIRSPIAGVIISKNANVGEPVMPGQENSLFVVANDLRRMELVANVSEADIGRIKTGNSAFFTVDAYPDENFNAEVSQIRNSPVTRQNVVTYEIVLPVDNSELKLRPGMTAYVKVIIEKKQNIVRVPNIALKFTPPPDLIPETSEHFSVGKPESATVWVLSNDGKPKPVKIKVGMRDNNFTQIRGGQLQEGDRVIAELIQKNDSILGSIISPQMNY